MFMAGRSVLGRPLCDICNISSINPWGQSICLDPNDVREDHVQ